MTKLDLQLFVYRFFVLTKSIVSAQKVDTSRKTVIQKLLWLIKSNEFSFPFPLPVKFKANPGVSTVDGFGYDDTMDGGDGGGNGVILMNCFYN